MEIDENETLNLGQLKKYAAYYMVRKKLKAKYDEYGKKLEKMAPSLITHLVDRQLDKVPLKGGRTIYIDTKIWGKYLEGKNNLDLVTAAKEDGIFELLGGKENVNMTTLASYLRELNQNEEPLPKNLARVIKPNPKDNLIVKKH